MKVQVPYHAIEQVQSSKADGLILVVQTLEDEVFVRLHWLGVALQDLWHGQQAQVLHYISADTHMMLAKQSYTLSSPHPLMGTSVYLFLLWPDIILLWIYNKVCHIYLLYVIFVLTLPTILQLQTKNTICVYRRGPWFTKDQWTGLDWPSYSKLLLHTTFTYM